MVWFRVSRVTIRDSVRIRVRFGLVSLVHPITKTKLPVTLILFSSPNLTLLPPDSLL